jgi:hypothetical protein
LSSQAARAIMLHTFGYLGEAAIMITLFSIAVVVLIVFGLFAWRYEAATTGGTGGIVKLLEDRLVLARLRRLKPAEPGIES